ncbi:MAG TPA: peptidoglycan recognition family protein [Planctomycetota bacterium]|nr:peptidoglycan recognition family protein [Planctomycetota bacterium]
MTKTARTLRASLLSAVAGLSLIALLGACAGPDAPRRPPGASGKAGTSLAKLDALAAKGRHAEVVELADVQLATARDRVLVLELELRRSRALIEDRRVHSAVLGLQRAESRLTADDTALARQVHELWGLAELRRDRPAEAAKRFQRALGCGRPDRKTTERLQYGALVALREAQSPQAAKWKQRILLYSDARLAAAEKELLGRVTPAAPTPSKAVAVDRSIPSDPRALLPTIHTRSEWGAAPIKGDYDPMLPITRVCVHHSALDAGSTSPAAVGAELRQLQASHQQKWADLGYHFVIDPGGGIWEGRNLRWQGAHEGAGLNQGSIGICLLGNFDDAPAPAAQLGALKTLLDEMRGRWALTAADIKTHREMRPEPTACPGARLQGWVDDYRRALTSGSLARQ